MHQHRILEDTVYFGAGSNDTSGSGNDGASAVFDVRLAGAAAGAAPVLSGSATLLTHVNFPAGCYEIAIAATDGNGFAAGNTYLVYFTLLVDSQNPTGFMGSFSLEPIISDLREMSGVEQSATDLKDFADSGYDPGTNKVQGVVSVDTTTTNTDMRGTDGANTTTPPTVVQNRQEMDSNSTQLAAIVADTNELQIDWVNGGRLDLILDAILANTRILSFRKNTAFLNFAFTMRNSAGAPLTGLTITSQRILDAGSAVSTANTASEVDGTGVYRISFDAADVNADFGTFLFSSGGAITKTIHFKTVL